MSPKLRIIPKVEAAVPGGQSNGEPPPILSFQPLYDEHFEFTWRVLRHLGLNGPALNDGCQELWLVVHRRLPNTELHCEVRTWLFGIAVNVARNHRRTAARRGRGTELPTSLAWPGPDPEAQQSARETWTAVQRFLSSLDERDCWIFVFNVIEQMSAGETARALDIDIATVYQRARVLKRSVKKWLDG